MQLIPQNQKIKTFLQQGQTDEALELAFETYFPSLKKKWLATYSFFTENELEYAFGKAFSNLKKEGDLAAVGDCQNYLEEKGMLFLKSNHQVVLPDHPDVEIIRAILEKKTVWRFFDHNLESFLGFAAKNYPSCDPDTVQDVYHDAWIVVLVSYIQKGRIRFQEGPDDKIILIGLRNNATLSTFLFGIAKRMLLKKCTSRELYVDPDDFLKPYFELPQSEDEEKNAEQIKKLLSCLKLLSKSCQEILRCKYWYGMSMEEIKEQIGARSAGAVRTRKKRCMDRLEALLREKDSEKN